MVFEFLKNLYNIFIKKMRIVVFIFLKKLYEIFISYK